jgi:hypothetical protein
MKLYLLQEFSEINQIFELLIDTLTITLSIVSVSSFHKVLSRNEENPLLKFIKNR